MAILTGIGLALAITILIINKVVPRKVQGIEKIEEIASVMPGMNCGACGHPGCFAYAQALAANRDSIADCKCALVIREPEKLEALQQIFGQTLDLSNMKRRAVVQCGGNSEVIFNYSGAMTCKGAAQLQRGNKQCPYACLGIGDCVKVCPEGAISIEPETGVAAINWDKCTGCGLCLLECPQKVIKLVPEDTKIGFLCNYAPLRDIPGREKCEAGCIHCRKCFLACEAGAITWNKEKAVPEFDARKCTLCLKCIDACKQKVLRVVVDKEGKEVVACAAVPERTK
ncbi:MAG: 4Fe-4S binding protein [Dehalococcoidales bacterium]|nr:4Fe-4S binding protein [Dehalococcoidales bacterium]